MKIAQVVCSFPPYMGGIGNVAYYYSEELAALGHEVVVFTPEYKNYKFEELSVKFKVKALTPFVYHGKSAMLTQVLWQLKSFDIVHLHYPFFGTAELIWFLKKLKRQKVKLVLSYHMDVVGKGVLGAYFNFHTRFIMPAIVKSAEKIVASSFDYIKTSKIKNIFEKFPDKFIELPFGVTGKFFPKEKNLSLLQKYGLENSRIVLFVGGLDKPHYFKGVNFLLKAIKLLPGDTNLILVGKGELKDEYQRMAQELGIRNRVVFEEDVVDLNDYYNLCDVFVLPSVDRSEAFGIVLVEAMAAAKPVISSNLPGIRTVVLNNENGFLAEPKNHEDLAQKIMMILNDEDKKIAFGKKSRELVDQKYLWREIVKNLETVYFDLLKN